MLTSIRYICRVRLFFPTFILCLFCLNGLAGTITRSATSLFNFGNVYPFHSSTPQRYTVSGTALSANLLITADNGFEVSLSYASGYCKTITLVPSAGTIANTTIFVRFSPSATGALSGVITNSSTGSTSQTVSVGGTGINWAIPANFYNNTSGSGATLKTNVYTIISAGNSVGSYDALWTTYQTSDVQTNGKVWDIYSTRNDVTSPYEFTFVTDQCGNYSTEGDCYNREHSFPQSWFTEGSPMKNDAHHVFASDGKVNGMRSNFPYGNVSSATFTSLYGGKLGTGTNNSGYSGTVFEPIDEYKGDLARAQLYMITRYQNLITGWQNNGNANEVLSGNTYPGYDSWYINLLLSWNNLDPVSDKEIKRNNAIYIRQNNRNPFVDSPQFVKRIWGGSAPSKPTLSASSISVTNNSNTSVTLTWQSGNGNRRIVIMKANSAVDGFPADSSHFVANTNFTTAPQIGSGNRVVYNGTGSSVTVTNLTQGTSYHYAVIEYNGWYSSSNYQTSGFATFSANTLPVDLTAFTVHESAGYAHLQWTTASELNNKGFEIELSVDALKWENIGFAKGAGTSSATHRYQHVYSLEQNTSPVLYFRLKQLDFDGKFAYSPIRSLLLNQETQSELLIAPNPFVNDLRISFDQAPVSGGTLKIQNLIGETYVEQQIDPANKFISIDNLDHLPAGMYILQWDQNQQKRNYKIIKR